MTSRICCCAMERSRSSGTHVSRAAIRTARDARSLRRSRLIWRAATTCARQSRARSGMSPRRFATLLASVAGTGRSGTSSSSKVKVQEGDSEELHVLSRYTELMPLIAVSPDALDVRALTQEVTRSRAGDGAVASFIGLVRDHNQGRRVSFLDYEAYEPLAVRALGRIAGRSRPGVARHASRHASPDGPHRDRRSQRDHRGGVASSRQRLCRVPVQHRANQADCPDLEARALRGRRRLAGGRHSGSRRRVGPAGGVSHRVRVTVRLFARLRDLAGSGELVRDVEAPATVQSVWRGLVTEMPALGDYEKTMSVAVNADYSRMSAPVSEGDEVAFLPPVSGG